MRRGLESAPARPRADTGRARRLRTMWPGPIVAGPTVAKSAADAEAACDRLRDERAVCQTVVFLYRARGRGFGRRNGSKGEQKPRSTIYDQIRGDFCADRIRPGIDARSVHRPPGRCPCGKRAATTCSSRKVVRDSRGAPEAQRVPAHAPHQRQARRVAAATGSDAPCSTWSPRWVIWRGAGSGSSR